MILKAVNTKTYKSLGVKFISENGEEWLTDCPYCGKSKMYVNATSGQYNCKVCGKSGNKYTWMREAIYDRYLKETELKDYQALSKLRGNIPPIAFQDAGMAYHRGRKEWMIPFFNEKGVLVNLRFWDKNTNIIKSTGGCSNSLFGMEKINGEERIVVCEGEWDAIALRWLFKETMEEAPLVVAVPGSSVFKDDWARFFYGKTAIFLYDNDAAGRDGQNRAIVCIKDKTVPAKIFQLEWGLTYPEKYDVRDLIVDNLKNIHGVWSILQDLMVEPKVDDKQALLVRTSFAEVLEDYKKHIFVTEEMRIGLILQFAVIFSNALTDCPLWLFIVGAAGSGKSLILQSLSGSDMTHYISTLNARTLISGYKTEDGSDPSLLPKIIGKTLIIKEYTEILALASSEQDKVFATLRGAYDGRVDVPYGNNLTRTYPTPGSGHKTCHFSIIAGVTDTIHGTNKASLGERFLKYQMFPTGNDCIGQMRAAMYNTLEQRTPEFELKASAKAFITHKMANPWDVPTVPKYIQDRIIGLAQIVAIARASVERKQGELSYRPSAEVGTRLCKQLVKHAQCVAYVLDKDEVDDECYMIIQQVGLSTGEGWTKDILLTLAKHPEGLTKKQVSTNAKISVGNCAKYLDDLYELRAVEREQIPDGNVGQPAYRWKLSEALVILFDLAQIENNYGKKDEKAGKRRFVAKTKTIC